MRGVFALITRWEEEQGIYSRTRLLQIADSRPVLEPTSFPFFDSFAFEKCLNRLILSNETEVDEECEDYFPFLDLPEELIGHIFSFLSIKDRLKARVNKRLNNIELMYKYYVDYLRIDDVTKKLASRVFVDEGFCFVEGRSYTSDCLRRISQNVSIGSLNIFLCGSTVFHGEVYSVIKELDIKHIDMNFGSNQKKKVMVDSFFLDLTRACSEMSVGGCEVATPEAFHQVYMMMKEGSIKLRKIDIWNTSKLCTSFLGHIGITYREGRFFSDRNIEAMQRITYEGEDQQVHYTCLFDGNIEIALNLCRTTYYYSGSYYWWFADFSLEVHKTQESLDSAKNKDGYTRVIVVTE